VSWLLGVLDSDHLMEFSAEPGVWKRLKAQESIGLAGLKLGK